MEESGDRGSAEGAAGVTGTSGTGASDKEVSCHPSPVDREWEMGDKWQV